MRTGRSWNPPLQIWPRRKVIWHCASRKPRRLRPLSRSRAATGSNRGSRSWKRGVGIALRNQLAQAEERLAGIDREASGSKPRLRLPIASGGIRRSARATCAGV